LQANTRSVVKET